MILVSNNDDFIGWSASLYNDRVFCELVFIAANAAEKQKLYDRATNDYIGTITIPKSLQNNDLAQRGNNMSFLLETK